MKKKVDKVWNKFLTAIGAGKDARSQRGGKSNSTVDEGSTGAGYNISAMLTDFTNKRHLGGDSKQDAMAMMVQKQIEQYNADVEKRRQKLLEQAVTNVAAVTGKKVVKRDSDDALPYMPKKIDWAVIAKKVAAKKAAMVEAAKKKAAGVEEKPKVKASPSVSAVANLEAPDEEKKSAAAIGTSSQRSQTDSSASEKSSSEQTGQITDLLTDILLDAQSPEKAKEQENIRQMSVYDLIKLSRSDVEQFDHLTNENTKDSIFLAQPNNDEFQAYHRGQARVSTYRNEIDLSNAKVDVQVFCRECKPRHPNYPFMKK